MSIKTDAGANPRDNKRRRTWTKRLGPIFIAAIICAQTAVALAEGSAWGAVKVGAGDRLAITVFGQTELSGEYLIGDDGDILLPLGGAVTVAGLTLAEIQKSIAQQLADGYLRDPIVGARIAELRPIYIVGEVKLPGSYPFRFGATVLSGVAVAGGYGRIEAAGVDRRIDFIASDERVQSLEARKASLTIKLARLAAQREGAAAFEPPPQPGMGPEAFRRVAEQETQVFTTETRALAAELDTLGKQRPRIDADIVAVKEQLEAETKQLLLIRDHIAGYSQLLEAGYARRYTGIELQREEARNRGNVARLRSELARLDLSILEGELRTQTAQSTSRRRVLYELDTARSQLAEIEVSLPAAAELRAARLQQASPMMAASESVRRYLTIVRQRGGEPARIAAEEITPLQPGDIVEVRIESGLQLGRAVLASPRETTALSR